MDGQENNQSYTANPNQKVYDMPHFVDHEISVLDVFFAQQEKVYEPEDKTEVINVPKKTTVKEILKPFKKDKKKLNLTSTPSSSKTVLKIGDTVTVNWKENVHQKDEKGELKYDYPKINNLKVGKKLFIVADCLGEKGKLTIEILENKLTNAEVVYDNPVKFLIGEEEKTKIEFTISKEKTRYKQEITLRPKTDEDLKKLVEKFNTRTDKKAFLYLKGDITETQDDIKFPDETHEFCNLEKTRLEVLGSPCYCGVDFTVDQIKDFYKSNDKIRSLFTATNCPLPKEKRNYEDFTKELNAAMKEYEINTCIRKAHFLAQIEAETFFATSLEYADGWDYDHTTHLDNYNNYELYLANKKMKKNPYEAFNTKAILRSHNRYEECLSFGHNVKGYGPKYKGSGLIQLTWRKTHLAYLTHKGKADLIDTDYPIASDLNLVCDSAGWYWKNKSTWGNLNSYADKDDLICASVGVNGGLNGFDHRKSNLKKILNLLDVKENCLNLEIGDKELGIYKYGTSAVKNTKWGKNNKSKIESHDD